MLMTIAATPLDIPHRPPACTGYADLPLRVPSGMSGLVSACMNRPAYAPDVILISNLSDDVLEIRSASASQPAFRAYYPLSGNRSPLADQIEIYAQVASIRQLDPQAGTILLPVGGYVIATQDVPIQLTVQVDQYASAVSYAAQLMSGDVVDNLTEQIPAARARSYETGIAACVGGAQSRWPGLYQLPSATAPATLQAPLGTIPACLDLQKKITSNHAEVLSIAAAERRLTGRLLRGDLAMVAGAAGQASWESHLAEVAKVTASISEGTQ